MSLKLGNTNIAGTQILYSTTGNNTDGAMNQAITTTQLNLKANDADVVHKTGDETITGNKTFSSAVTFANGTWNALGDDAYFGDSNLSGAFCIKGNNASSKIALFDRNSSYSNGFYIDESDGNALKLNNTTYGANAWGSVTAMVAQSLSGNGYIKFNHGLIIQWGRSSTTTDGYVTFPTPFNNACTAVIPTRISSGDAQSNIFENASTTRFKIKIYGGYSSSAYFYWIAVGY